MSGATFDASSFSLLDIVDGAELMRDDEAPRLFAVWLDGDIIGSGDDADEAIEEARATCRAWSNS